MGGTQLSGSRLSLIRRRSNTPILFRDTPFRTSAKTEETNKFAVSRRCSNFDRVGEERKKKQRGGLRRRTRATRPHPALVAASSETGSSGHLSSTFPLPQDSEQNEKKKKKREKKAGEESIFANSSRANKSCCEGYRALSGSALDRVSSCAPFQVYTKSVAPRPPVVDGTLHQSSPPPNRETENSLDAP